MANLHQQLSEGVEKYLHNTDQLERTTQVVENAVERTLGRTQQHLISELEELARTAGRNLADELNENIFSLASSWFDQRRGDMMIMPEGTKFAHRHGDSLYVVVEEKPQVRTLGYARDNRTRKFRIGLPYMIFLFRFQQFQGDDGRTHLSIGNFKAAFAKQPITSLEQMLYVPPLPNLETSGNRGHEYLKVCMGRDFRNPVGVSLTQQVQIHVDHWWQSPFGTDWDSAFKEMGARDNRFSSFDAWEKATANDAFFALEAPYQEAGTLSKILTTGFDEEGIDTPLRRMIQKSISQLCDKCAEKIRGINIDDNYKEKFVGDAIHRVVAGAVRECVGSLSGEILTDERAKLSNEKHRIESGLHELLFELERRVNARGQEEGYWWKK